MQMRRKFLFATIAIVLSSTIALLVSEIAYRVKLFGPFAQSQYCKYRIGQQVYGEYDQEFGQRFVPRSRMIMGVVRDGRVLGCLGEVASANEDGLGGKDTLAMYKRSAIRLLTTGDSLTHWKRGGLTIPDVVAARLSADAGKRVANLNFARGAYGVLHMLRIGSRMSEVHRPDLLIIQFISDDLTRGWWWTRNVTINGRTRALISATESGSVDGHANDQLVIDGRATGTWCEERLAKGDEDEVLKDSNLFYSSYLQQKGLATDPWALSKSYLLQRLIRIVASQPNQTLIPQIGYEEFRSHPVVLEAAASLRRSKTHVAFVHVPLASELTGGIRLSGEQQRIWRHIETTFNVKVITTQDVTMPAMPAKIDLLPVDGHPNIEGIMFYGEYVARAVRPLIIS